MSLRPEISGFDFASMQKVFNSKDQDLLTRLQSHYLEFTDQEEVDDQEEDDDELSPKKGLDYIKKIVNGELVPIQNGIRAVNAPEAEDINLIYAVISIAFFEQEHLGTDSNMWKSAFLDYPLNVSTLIDEVPDDEADKICELSSFLLGRPLFGGEFDSDWTTYGYLTKSEVRELSNFFKKYPQMETDEDQFGADLHGWLNTIAANDKDLWFFCQ